MAFVVETHCGHCGLQLAFGDKPPDQLCLVDQLEDVRHREQDGHGAAQRDAEEDEQQQPVDHRGDEAPVVANLCDLWG